MIGSGFDQELALERIRARQQAAYGARSVAPSAAPTTSPIGPAQGVRGKGSGSGAGLQVQQVINIPFADSIRNVPTEILRLFYDDLMKELGKRGELGKL